MKKYQRAVSILICVIMVWVTIPFNLAFAQKTSDNADIVGNFGLTEEQNSVYTVVGSAGLCGSGHTGWGWDYGDESNDMLRIGDGVYAIRYLHVDSTDGKPYEFIIGIDHSDDEYYDDNGFARWGYGVNPEVIRFEVDEPDSTVTIFLDTNETGSDCVRVQIDIDNYEQDEDEAHITVANYYDTSQCNNIGLSGYYGWFGAVSTKPTVSRAPLDLNEEENWSKVGAVYAKNLDFAVPAKKGKDGAYVQDTANKTGMSYISAKVVDGAEWSDSDGNHYPDNETPMITYEIKADEGKYITGIDVTSWGCVIKGGRNLSFYITPECPTKVTDPDLKKLSTFDYLNHFGCAFRADTNQNGNYCDENAWKFNGDAGLWYCGLADEKDTVVYLTAVFNVPETCPDVGMTSGTDGAVEIRFMGCKIEASQENIGAAVGTDCLCFTAQEANSTVELTINHNEMPSIDVQYSTDGISWYDFIVNETKVVLDNVGDKVYFKGNNSTLSEQTAGGQSGDHDDRFYRFKMTGRIAASGEVTSLLNENIDDVSIEESDHIFAYLFAGCDSLVSAPSLSLTKLGAGCYSHMFYGCSSLEEAPELPADTLTQSCYESMFENCTSLRAAPSLPSTDLAESCYESMFRGCSALMTAPLLPAQTMKKRCYAYMFADCTALTEPPVLPDTDLTGDCFEGIFDGCDFHTARQGDLNGDETVDRNDAIYLLFNSIFGEEDYPLNQSGDMNGDGVIDRNDSIYLLFYTVFPDDYPLFNW